MGGGAEAADLLGVYGAALEGDMVKALAILDTTERVGLNASDSITARCMRETFSTPPHVEDIPRNSQKILLAYREYWQTVLMKRSAVEEAERELLPSLNAIVVRDAANGGAFASLDEASEAAKGAIEKEGLFALTGVTLPYYELMIWKTQTPVTYRVALVEHEIDVNVVFLDGFVSLGWAGYATCGHSYSGGWATTDSLYAVRPAYDTASEDFRVSYLAHEGRHFSDYKEFPMLKQPELEYRAKLTELAVSKQSTHDLIVRFSGRCGQDRSAPHHFANYWVVKEMSPEVFDSDEPVDEAPRWHGVSARRIRHAAERLLRRNNDSLRRLGAAAVEQFLDVMEE